MVRLVFYLAVMVLLQTAAGLEWEFGSNLSGSQTIMEREGIIPSHLREELVQISKPSCTEIIYVKVEVEDMPIVTYNIHLGMVIIKFEKGRRAKNSEFRVTAKGVKTEGGKCGGSTPRAVTRYPGREYPNDATPHFQLSKEYFPEDAPPNNASPNDEHSGNAHSYDGFANDAHPYDAEPNNGFPNDAHLNDEHSYDAEPNDGFLNDAQLHTPYDAHPDDV